MARHAWSPLSLLICVGLFFSSNVFAISAVLGVDLGTEYIKAVLVKPGIPFEIVLTKDSRRKEISAVTFKPNSNGAKKGEYPERAYGSDAMALSGRFPGDAYPNLKTLLGLPADHAVVKDYAARHPALKLEAHKTRKTTAIKSSGAFTPEEDAWMVEELLAMELQSIQKNAEALAGTGSSVRSVVITVPPFYTIEEKRAVELAADIAGLRVLSLISDGLAVGLNYATSRQFPNINNGSKPEHHMVFDMGAGSTKATVMKFQSRDVKDIGKFNKTIQEVVVLGSGWDRTLGGDSLNSLIVDDMIAKFVETNAAKKVSAKVSDVKAHGRAVAKLTKDAERLRHVLSANTNTGASFEGLYEDVDFKYKLSRAEFETMAEAYADRVEVAVQNALKMAGLKDSDLDSVILHGGATRTPFVQKQLQKIFGGADKLRTNVNSDESAAFGAGFRAAEISPSFRVKEIRISEGSVYPAGMSWKNSKDVVKNQQLWTATSHLGAAPKEFTWTNRPDFSLEFYQQVPSADGQTENRPTKTLTTKNLTATHELLKEKHSCEPSTVRFKLGMKLNPDNGEVEITKATAECDTEEVEKEGIIDGVKNLFGFGKNKDQQPLKDGEASEESSSTSSSETSTSTTKTSAKSSKSSKSGKSSATSSSSSASASESTEAKPKKVTIVIPIQYELVKAGVPELTKEELTTVKDRMKAFETSDKNRRLREEALNQLEGFTYKVRDLLENEGFIAASKNAERKSLETLNGETSDWLYGDGADASRDELKKRLKALQDIVKPIQTRIDEQKQRPELIDDLKKSLNTTIEWVGNIKKQIVEYEDWLSSSSAAAAASTPTTTVDSSSTETPAASKDDFDGLEDEDATSTTTAAESLPTKEVGPAPPIYSSEDLQGTLDLHAEIHAWLVEKEVAQEALDETEDAVLTVKDLREKREKLDKAGMDLAMKAVRDFEARNKKANKSKSAKSSKTKKAKASTKTEGAAPKKIKINAGKDGKLSEEDIAEMLKQYAAENPTDAEKKEAEEKHVKDEL